jgi:ABC-type nickel/cobalt efflux system permease component RcnA
MVIATTVGETFGIGVILSAFFFGFRHGIDWDHIAAITDIAGSQDDRRSAMLFGTLYALGHGLVVFVIGTAAILLGERLPPSIDNVMERIVGVTLIVLGVFVFVSLAKHGREFRLRSRWMLIFSGVRHVYRRVSGSREDAHDLEPVHVHGAEGSEEADRGSVAIAVADDIPISDWHHGHHGRPGHHHHKHPEPDDAFMNYGTRTAFVVGMIHGVGAETPTQIVIFLAAAGAGGKAVGEVVLAAFIIGLLTSNSVITFGSAVGFIKASENWRIYVSIAVITAVFSLVIGTLFLFGNGAVLPAIFGG